MKQIKHQLFIKLFVFALTSSSITAVAQTTVDPIEEANLYAARVKSSIRYASFFGASGTSDGAGFLIDKDNGLILSNAHVAGYGTAEIEISFKNERYHEGKVLYVDTEHDLAILGLNPKFIPSTAREAKLDCSSRKLNGIEVAAFGHPEGLTYSASRGIVSQVRVYEGVDWVQTDAAINPGNSGGPLIDLRNGLVVGINAMALKDTEGLNFAVPAKPICKILDIYKAGSNAQPPLLPFSFASNEDTEEYLILAGNRFGEMPNGFEIGDRIKAVNEIEVETPTEVLTILRGTDGNASFTIKRGDKTLRRNVEFGFEEGYLDKPYLLVDGALIAEAYYAEMWNSDKLYQVHSIRKGSDADKYGIYNRGTIIAVDGKHPQNLAHLRDLLDVNKEVKITFRRWSSRDRYLYDFFEVQYKAKDVQLKNAM